LKPAVAAAVAVGDVMMLAKVELFRLDAEKIDFVPPLPKARRRQVSSFENWIRFRIGDGELREQVLYENNDVPAKMSVKDN